MRSYISFPSKLHQKINWNNVDFFSIELRSKKVHENDIDISVTEITPNKVRRNDVDFLPIEIRYIKKVHLNGVKIYPYQILNTYP